MQFSLKKLLIGVALFAFLIKGYFYYRYTICWENDREGWFVAESYKQGNALTVVTMSKSPARTIEIYIFAARSNSITNGISLIAGEEEYFVKRFPIKYDYLRGVYRGEVTLSDEDGAGNHINYSKIVIEPGKTLSLVGLGGGFGSSLGSIAPIGQLKCGNRLVDISVGAIAKDRED